MSCPDPHDLSRLDHIDARLRAHGRIPADASPLDEQTKRAIRQGTIRAYRREIPESTRLQMLRLLRGSEHWQTNGD